MPNTKSAERRTRLSAVRHARNQSTRSRLHTLERKYRALLSAGKTDEAHVALRATTSALDKAAKKGVIPRRRADRKKSRLALTLKAPSA
jgi:small subunit ribosomal protein S20